MAGKLIYSGKDDAQLSVSDSSPVYGFRRFPIPLVTGTLISQLDAIRKYRQDMGLTPLEFVVTDPYSRSLNAVEGE